MQENQDRRLAPEARSLPQHRNGVRSIETYARRALRWKAPEPLPCNSERLHGNRIAERPENLACPFVTHLAEKPESEVHAIRRRPREPRVARPAVDTSPQLGDERCGLAQDLRAELDRDEQSHMEGVRQSPC